MKDRFKFRIGFTASYYDDDGNDKTTQLKISEDFSVICGGSDVRIHNDIIEEAIDELNPTDHERTTIIDYIETNYCCNDGFWLIDNIDYLDRCTGLKDKNGKLIYDGDILRAINSDTINRPDLQNGYIWVDELDCRWIKFKKEELSWNDFCSLIDYDCTLTIEVIGNIHVNKELLND